MKQPLEDQARLYLSQEMEYGETMDFTMGMAGVFSCRSPNKETPNEDAAALIPVGLETGVLVVADGLGGMRSGEQASGLAVQVLKTEVQEAASQGLELRNGILNGIEKANHQISALGVGAATTLAAIEIQGRTVRPYHVGDSMIMVVGQRGKIKLQTVSHSPVAYAVEAGFLDESEAMNHEERHLISNMIGTTDMRIEMGATMNLAPKDTLLIASDGLFDNLHTDEIVERVRKGPLKNVLQLLAATCRDRMQGAGQDAPSKPDDLTFIVFRSRAQTKTQQ